jgi:hypothetical protein
MAVVLVKQMFVEKREDMFTFVANEQASDFINRRLTHFSNGRSTFHKVCVPS